MAFHQLELQLPRDRAELTELALETQGAIAITLHDAVDDPVYEPPPGEIRVWPKVRLVALFGEETNRSDVEQGLVSAFSPNKVPDCLWTILEDEPWERRWLTHFRPTRFGRRLWICPTGQPCPDPDAEPIWLDPGLAFGTGSHETTAMCLRWLDQAPLRDASVLDYGCGSGILAIAALRLGALSAVGVDIDPQALAATRSNAGINQVASSLHAMAPEELAGGQFDIVLANILAGPLVELAPLLGGLTAAGGNLVVSGILAGQADDVARAYANTVEWHGKITEGDWVLLHGTRR